MLFVVDHRTSSVIELASIKVGASHRVVVPDPATGGLRKPYAVARAPKRTLVVADSGNNRVVVLDLTTGASVPLAPTAASGVGPLLHPRGVAVATDGTLAIADTGNRRVVWTGFTLAAVAAGTADLDQWRAFGQATVSGSTGVGDFEAPTGVHVDAGGRTWVTDPGLARLVRVDDATGAGWTDLPVPAGAAAAQPYGVAGHPLGVLVTDLVNARVLLVDVSTDIVSTLIEGALDRRVIAPVSAVGHGRNIIVADAAGARLARWSPDGAGGWAHSGELLGIPQPGGGPGQPSFAQITGLGTSGASS